MKYNRIVQVLFVLSTILPSLLFSQVREFQIVKSKIERNQKIYYDDTVKGIETMNPNPLNRLSMLSEDQIEYPVPESGCGPTAMLNILAWYEKFGLIKPDFQGSNAQDYKQTLFIEIDRRLRKQSGQARTEEIGTYPVDAAIVMDSLVNDRSNGKLRIHSDIIKPPLKFQDLMETSTNFRAGLLSVIPKDNKTGKFLNHHAVVLVRVDRTGTMTIGNWGEYYYGGLKQRPDGQWFIPQNPEHLELKINHLMRFIPFKPISN